MAVRQYNNVVSNWMPAWIPTSISAIFLTRIWQSIIGHICKQVTWWWITGKMFWKPQVKEAIINRTKMFDLTGNQRPILTSCCLLRTAGGLILSIKSMLFSKRGIFSCFIFGMSCVTGIPSTASRNLVVLDGL